MIALSRVDLTPAEPDDPAARCCSWCGSAAAELTAEDGFGDEIYCADTTSCVARHRARVPPLPVPGRLAAMRDAAESARAELAAMTEATRAFARDYGRRQTSSS